MTNALSSALSPLDGRYAQAVTMLRPFFSEEALNRARVEVEIRYLIALAEEPGVTELKPFTVAQEDRLLRLVEEFDDKAAARVKTIEAKTRHDVKAVEYYLREQLEAHKDLKAAAAFLHFALTSEDVNNLSYGILIQEAIQHVFVPDLQDVLKQLKVLARSTAGVRLLSLTHGQPATPTLLGKEMQVFILRLERQIAQLKAFTMQGKFGGAVGNFSAHKVAYPQVKWEKFRTKFVKSLGLEPLQETTQINPHDDIAELSHLISRINTIFIDFSRDVWMYISRGVFKQRVVAGEVGSSTMPHKVNPIDFENAEGNLGLSTALFTHFADKLPISRLQRDLSDSTVQRNIGVAFGYHTLALASLRKGLSKLAVNREAIAAELAAHPEVIAEAIQTVLRKHGVTDAYEQLKALTRGTSLTADDFAEFIVDLDLPGEEKERLLGML